MYSAQVAFESVVSGDGLGVVGDDLEAFVLQSTGLRLSSASHHFCRKPMDRSQRRGPYREC